MIRLALALVLPVFAFAAQAQMNGPAAPGTITLTPEQREAALEAGAARAMDDSLQYGAADRRVHGEIGVEVGSRGERAAYGTMVAPIGQNGTAIISYGAGQGPRWRGRRHFHGRSISGQISSESASPAPSASDAEIVNSD